MPHQACFELPRFRVDGRRLSVGWLTLTLSVAALTGCTLPYYAAYRNYPPPVYVPPPYAAQPPIERSWPTPYPLFPSPEVRQEPAPMRDDSVTVLELPPLPDPIETPFPETAAPPSLPSRPPGIQAGPGNDAPLQGFRPMRGQTRPGI